MLLEDSLRSKLNDFKMTGVLDVPIEELALMRNARSYKVGSSG